ESLRLVCCGSLGRVGGTAVTGVGEDAQWLQPPVSGMGGERTGFCGRRAGSARTAGDLGDDAPRTPRLHHPPGEAGGARLARGPASAPGGPDPRAPASTPMTTPRDLPNSPTASARRSMPA